jgi:hypothetical protein
MVTRHRCDPALYRSVPANNDLYNRTLCCSDRTALRNVPPSPLCPDCKSEFLIFLLTRLAMASSLKISRLLHSHTVAAADHSKLMRVIAEVRFVYVRPATLVRITDGCGYGSYEGRCVITVGRHLRRTSARVHTTREGCARSHCLLETVGH